MANMILALRLDWAFLNMNVWGTLSDIHNANSIFFSTYFYKFTLISFLCGYIEVFNWT